MGQKPNMQRPKMPIQNDSTGPRVHNLSKTNKNPKNEGSNISVDEAVEGDDALVAGQIAPG